MAFLLKLHRLSISFVRSRIALPELNFDLDLGVIVPPVLERVAHRGVNRPKILSFLWLFIGAKTLLVNLRHLICLSAGFKRFIVVPIFGSFLGSRLHIVFLFGLVEAALEYFLLIVSDVSDSSQVHLNRSISELLADLSQL
jgi:hypothetical protein